MISTIIYVGIIIGIAGTSILVLRKSFLKVQETKEELEKIKYQLKSAYVRFGKSFEHFVPFIKDFPGNKERTTFIGNPVDFLVWDDTGVKFVEVKTGSSQLNTSQKNIRKLIEEGKVYFLELRYDEEIPKVLN